MCTLNELEDDIFGSEEMPKEAYKENTLNNVVPLTDVRPCCKVCESEQVRVSLRNGNVYCEACFLSVSTHKFKATLGKSRSVRTTDSVLVAHSGKANSTVLVHLVKHNASKTNSKKIPFRSKVLYVDDGMTKGRTIEEREFIRSSLAKEAEDTQLETYFVPLSKCVRDDMDENIESINVSRINTSEEDATIKEMFDRLESDTARDELLRQLRRKLFVSVARKLNCNKIFVADASVDLAIKVLANVSTGRGSQLPFDVAFSDERCTDVTLLRPLRDFTGDDVIGYLDCRQLRPTVIPEKHNRSFPASIRNVVRNFVQQLDSEFNGTVSTIYRTSDKLAAKLGKFDDREIEGNRVNADLDNNTCILCETSLDSKSLEEGHHSVLREKLFSKLVSTVPIDLSSNCTNNEKVKRQNDSNQEECYCRTNVDDSLEKRFLQPSVIQQYLCYGCRLIFSDSNQTSVILPNFMVNAIQEKLHRTRLRNEISEFLL